jgi:hypothetical protein
MLRTSFMIAGLSVAVLALAACSGDVETNGPGGGGSGGSGQGGSGQGGAPGVCGGKTGATCAADEFCDYEYDTCGANDITGLCAKRPMVCSDGPPVCFCDGTTSDLPCAGLNGFDIDGSGNCPDQPGTFPCGQYLCTEGIEYCQRSVSDVGGIPDSWSCRPVPSGCPMTADCACLTNEPCGTLCAVDNGGATVTCPGG